VDVSEILQGLNERQREAVTHPARAMRVIAGAGSGKTRVLANGVYRVSGCLGG